ncbi:hypothetical protein RJZ56_002975 [Blastomyces dermatitidis]
MTSLSGSSGGTGSSLAKVTVIIADRYGFKREQYLRPEMYILPNNNVECRKNYRKPLLQRYVVRILLMSVDDVLSYDLGQLAYGLLGFQYTPYRRG